MEVVSEEDGENGAPHKAYGVDFSHFELLQS